jgi:hypothetical protein
LGETGKAEPAQKTAGLARKYSHMGRGDELVDRRVLASKKMADPGQSKLSRMGNCIQVDLPARTLKLFRTTSYPMHLKHNTRG